MKPDPDEILRARRDPYRELALPGGCAVLLILFGVVGLLTFERGRDDLGRDSLGLWQAVAALTLGLGIWLLVLSLKRVWRGLAEERVGRVTVSLHPTRILPGQSITYRIEFRPRRSIALRGITLRLVCVEQRNSSDELGREVVTHDSAFAALRSEAIERREEKVVVGSIPIPLHALPSKPFSNPSRTWKVHARLDIPSWPDWTWEEKIRVLELPPRPEPELEATPIPRLADKQKVTVTVQQGQSCPFCRDDVAGLKPVELITCGGCKTVFHRACMAELNTCTTRGCRNRVRR